jgi:hypothetical protein
MQIVDLGLGAEDYKERFSNGARQTLHVTLTLSRVRHSREVARYRATTMIKRWPKFEIALRRVFATIQNTRDSLKRSGLPGFAHSLVRRSLKALFGSPEIFFYERSQEIDQNVHFAGMSLRPIDLEVLADGVTAHAEDLGTHVYLVRSAQRLRTSTIRGFALLNASSTPVHFCWVENFAIWLQDQQKTLQGTSESKAVVIFDDWTPQIVRGMGFCGVAARLVSDHMQLEGKSTWVLISPQNTISLREIERAGFRYRLSMRRSRLPVWLDAENLCGTPSHGGNSGKVT